MSEAQLQNIRQRLQSAKDEILKAQVVTEQIEKDWQEKYGTTDPKEIEAKLESLKTRLESLDQQYKTGISDALQILDTAGL